MTIPSGSHRRGMTNSRGIVPFDPAMLTKLVAQLGWREAAAEITGVSPRRVLDWIDQGRLRRRHLHRLMRAYLAKQRGVPMDTF
jgi:hypothetical protein